MTDLDKSAWALGAPPMGMNLQRAQVHYLPQLWENPNNASRMQFPHWQDRLHSQLDQTSHHARHHLSPPRGMHGAGSARTYSTANAPPPPSMGGMSGGRASSQQPPHGQVSTSFERVFKFSIVFVFDSRADVPADTFFHIGQNLSKALLIAEDRFEHLSAEVDLISSIIHEFTKQWHQQATNGPTVTVAATAAAAAAGSPPTANGGMGTSGVPNKPSASIGTVQDLTGGIGGRTLLRTSSPSGGPGASHLHNPRTTPDDSNDGLAQYPSATTAAAAAGDHNDPASLSVGGSLTEQTDRDSILKSNTAVDFTEQRELRSRSGHAAAADPSRDFSAAATGSLTGDAATAGGTRSNAAASAPSRMAASPESSAFASVNTTAGAGTGTVEHKPDYFHTPQLDRAPPYPFHGGTSPLIPSTAFGNTSGPPEQPPVNEPASALLGLSQRRTLQLLRYGSASTASGRPGSTISSAALGSGSLLTRPAPLPCLPESVFEYPQPQQQHRTSAVIPMTTATTGAIARTSDAEQLNGNSLTKDVEQAVDAESAAPNSSTLDVSSNSKAATTGQRETSTATALTTPAHKQIVVASLQSQTVAADNVDALPGRMQVERQDEKVDLADQVLAGSRAVAAANRSLSSTLR